jgi:predicted RNase H-like nuclease (RuvC/YqgF family)
MGKYIPVDPEKWAEMVKAMALVKEMDKTINASQAECRYLKAEVERLQNNCDYLDRELDREIDKTAMLCGEVERLRKFNDEALAHISKEERKSRECLDMAQAEVERLRKAGDAMAKVIDDDYLDTLQVWIDWNAAKEGKQS